MRAFPRWAAVLTVLPCVASCVNEQRPHGSAASHELVGQKAPLFAAALLNDSQFDLAEHVGRNVIILDFWATWCGPCVAALPVIAEVAKSYEDKGVALFAVNLQEDSAAVRVFLEEHKLDIAVVMDRDGAIGKTYKAEAIPQTVIIGKDGTVEVVHVGFVSDLKSELVHELDALVAGKKLAAAALRQPFAADVERADLVALAIDRHERATANEE